MLIARRLCLVAFLLLSACSVKQTSTENSANKAPHVEPPDKLVRARKSVEPFFKPMGEPGPFDWLATHKEKGQTFEEYLNEDPTVPTAERRTIYVQPLGKFTTAQNRAVNAAADYIGAFYGLPVKLLSAKQLSEPLRIKDFRTALGAAHRQIRTGYILDEVLRPAIPSDAAALLAFTNEDLFPDSSMNYVFGQASLENRVGVWSLSRLDDAADGLTFLRRTLKIAVHETGHMFGMRHCTKYECVMSGTNYLGETDRRPLDACPECMSKICWMTGTDPAVRYRRLADSCRRNGLTAEAAEFVRKAAAVG